MKTLAVLACVGLLAWVSEVSARTWYIKSDGTGDAATIQAGIDSAASGDTVLVALGIYHDCTHATPDGQTACVVMKSDVTLRSETGLPDCATIDAQGQGRVFFCDRVGVTVSIEGFTITGGAGPNGGGVCITAGGSSQVTFSRCTLSDNRADRHGGGLYCAGTPVYLEDCTVSANTCGDGGGGILLFDSGTCIFLGCTFTDNHCPAWGGAIDCIENVFASVHYCTFCGNGYFGLSFWESACGWLRNTIIANGGPGYAVYTMSYEEVPDFECCNIYGNAGGDWVSHIGQYDGINGNFSACPAFCHADAGDFHLCDESPCLPGNHPGGFDCGLIGAWEEGCSCGPSRIEPQTWGAIKSRYE